MPDPAPVTAWHREYTRAHTQGWIAYFIRAAIALEVRPEVLMGIASRETNMGGREIAPGQFEWLTKPGDGGHGFGIMQIDGRHYAEWVKLRLWQSAAAGIAQGAIVLADKRNQLLTKAGQLASVKDSKTKLTYRFKVPQFTPEGLERASIAAYNSGLWAAYHASKGRDVDTGTTGKNYARDVLSRADAFRTWLVADRWITRAVDEPTGSIT